MTISSKEPSPQTDVTEHRSCDAGFSVKLTGPKVARLYRASLGFSRSRSEPRSLRGNARARHQQWHGSAVTERRKPLITMADLEREFDLELGRRAIDPSETHGWDPLAVQTRISRLELGTSTSPS